MLAVIAFTLALPPVHSRITARFPSHSKDFSEKLRISSPVLYPLMVFFLCLGAIRYQLSLPTIDPSFIAYYNDQPYASIVEGIVTEPPDVRDTYINLRVKIDHILPTPKAQAILVKGFLLARLPTNVMYKFGDRIQLQGRLQTPPENEDFSYRDYLASHGIYSYLPYPSTAFLQAGQGNLVMSWLYALRDRAVKTVYALFPDPEASLISGILLGVQAGISPELQEAFRLTGTSHILVISGFNISIIAGVFTKLFRRWLGLYRGALVAALAIILYSILVGANAAVVRAAILGLFALGGQLIGRRQSGINSLVFAAALMALHDPNVLWDVSFQLSFAATLGIMLYAEPLNEWFIQFASRFLPPVWRERLSGPVSDYFLVTLAAQLTTLPLMVYYFKRISLTSLVANPLILPAQPLLMILGGLSIITGVIFRPLGQLFAWAAGPFITYTIRMVEWLATIPHSSVALDQVAFPLIVLFYLALFIFTFTRSKISNLASRLTPAMPLTVLGVIAVLVWKSAFYAPDGLLHVTILNVGTGDAVLVQTPGGRSVLINGGPSTNMLADALGRRMPLFNRRLDWLVVADIDNEDLAGVPGNVERFAPANVLWAGNDYGSYSASTLWTELDAQSITITPMQAGQILDLGSGATLQVVSTGSRGAVLLVSWDNFRMLLPMGMDDETLDSLSLKMAMRNISAVFLAESGYAPLNPPALLSFLHPQLALLSVAPADNDGLPSPETIQALEGYNLLRTDLNDRIQLTTDGKQMWVEVER